MNSILNLLWLIKRIDYPLDFKKYFFDGNRILGDSTTFLGLFVTTMMAGVYGYVLGGYGVIVAYGVFVGHMLSSFIKRRFSIPQGGYIWWAAYIDGAVIAGIILMLRGMISWYIVLLGVVSIRIISPLMTRSAYFLGIRDKNK